jgi:hypothetical protein
MSNQPAKDRTGSRSSGDVLANVALVISVIALLGALIHTWWPDRPSGASGAWRAPSDPVRPPVHDRLVETLNGDTVAIPKEGQFNVLIAYTTTCPFCAMSLPWWERAAKMLCDGGMVMVSPEPIAVQREYWQRMDWIQDACADVVVGRVLDPASIQAELGIVGTPAHYAIDGNRKIMGVWRGAVTDDAFIRDLIEMVSAADGGAAQRGGASSES